MPALHPRKLVVAAVIGAFIGAPLIACAYRVQGGGSYDFATLGAITGAVVASAFAFNLIRGYVVGAACGSVFALTMFQVPVCDGSHFGMPMLGMAAGLLVSAVIERVLLHQRST